MGLFLPYSFKAMIFIIEKTLWAHPSPPDGAYLPDTTTKGRTD